jgi:tetratricopeptide (TPR) repeat protein
VYANQEAIAFYTQALEVSPRVTPAMGAAQLLPVYEERGRVSFLLTKYEEAIADFQRMRQVARASGQLRQRVRLLAGAFSASSPPRPGGRAHCPRHL